MKIFKDLTGLKFGKLTVIGLDHKEKRKTRGYRIFWRCICDCGNECIVNGDSLKYNRQNSCGCLHIEAAVQRRKTYELRNTSAYRIWNGIKYRCFNKNCLQYPYYGGRGITMFFAWIDDFQVFYDYVSKLPHFGEQGYSLDRIDNNGNYEPNNIRWATRTTQSRNRRSNVTVEYNGKKITLAEASEITGVKPFTLHSRIKRGLTGEDLFKPVHHQ